MFGFGRSRNTKLKITNDMIYALAVVNSKYPSVIPGRTDKIAALALAIATKIVVHFFNEETFDSVLLKEHSIDNEFNPQWARQDALSRWYALGLICLTRCARDLNWSKSLTVDIGMQVYDATVETLWILWSMPDAIKDRIRLFMRSNIREITNSAEQIVNTQTMVTWSRRYAEVLKGGNPPWEAGMGEGSILSDPIQGECATMDIALITSLSARYEILRQEIMNLVCGYNVPLA